MEWKTFGINSQVRYQETVLDTPTVSKAYMLQNPSGMLIKCAPDGCVDLQLVYCGNEVRVFLAGSHLHHTEAQIMQYASAQKVFGVKFQPGTELEPLIGKHLTPGELVDSRVDITDICGLERLKDLFCREADFGQLLNALREEALPYEGSDYHNLVSYLIHELEQVLGNANISELAESTGYSQRYVDRIFKEKVGISIKKFSIIVRLQNALELIRSASADEVYNMLGYYDQAHFIHDFKDFTSYTPAKYKNMGNEFYYV